MLKSHPTCYVFQLLTPALKANLITIAITKIERLGKSLFRKRSDKMRKELEDAAREGSSRRSNSPVPMMPPNERTNSLSDLTGAAKAAGFYSDGLPKNIHLKFVSILCVIRTPTEPNITCIDSYRMHTMEKLMRCDGVLWSIWLPLAELIAK